MQEVISSDRPNLPRTFQIANTIPLNSQKKARILGKLYGTAMKFLRPERIRELKAEWTEYTGHTDGALNTEWYEYLAHYLVYGVTPDEYHCFHFSEMNDQGKRSYVTDLSRLKIYEKANSRKYDPIFDSKYQTYLKYKEYFRRDMILVNGDCDEFRAFLKRHDRFICKPVHLYLGRGIYIVRTADWDDPEDLLAKLLSNGEVVLEQLIDQSSEMSSLHPESLNTVRIITFRTDQGVVMLGAFLKAGRDRSVVDNAGSGGMFASVDIETGIVTGCAMDKNGREYLLHPNTKVCFPGFVIPEWEKALALCRELMEITPQTRYVGWDLAHTDTGWVVVEGNHTGQFEAHQILTKRGCAKEIEELLGQMSHE